MMVINNVTLRSKVDEKQGKSEQEYFFSKFDN